MKLGGNENEENEGNQGNEANELTIEYLEEGFKRLNIRVDNNQIKGFYQFMLNLGGNENEENEAKELTIEDLEEGFKRLNIKVNNNQIKGFYQFLLESGGNENEENEEGNEVTMEDLEDGFAKLNIRVNDNQIILRILDLLSSHKIRDKREKSIQHVMTYAKIFRPKMTILNQDFVDALADSIGEFIDNDFCLEDSDSDYEPPPKKEKPGSR